MNKNIIIVILVILVLAGLGYYFFTKFRAPTLAPELPQPPTPPVFEVPTTPTTATPTSEVIIKITTNGFEPKEVEITKGTKVTWVNEQPDPSWPASAVHPTHEVYPGSSIKKCGTPEQGKIFDACRGLNKGESWSFVFNEIGEWYYHDHLNPSWKGEIVVK
jgi:plastocyanin